MPNVEQIRAQIALLKAKQDENQKALDALEQEEKKILGREDSIRTISQIAAFKELFSQLKAREGLLGQVWHDIPAQALPREKLLANAFDLSETETANAKVKGVKAVSSL
jgi:hypothetical protein